MNWTRKSAAERSCTQRSVESGFRNFHRYVHVHEARFSLWNSEQFHFISFSCSGRQDVGGCGTRAPIVRIRTTRIRNSFNKEIFKQKSVDINDTFSHYHANYHYHYHSHYHQIMHSIVASIHNVVSCFSMRKWIFLKIPFASVNPLGSTPMNFWIVLETFDRRIIVTSSDIVAIRGTTACTNSSGKYPDTRLLLLRCVSIGKLRINLKNLIFFNRHSHVHNIPYAAYSFVLFVFLTLANNQFTW